MNEPFQVRIIKHAEKQLDKNLKFHRKEAVIELKKLAKNPYFGKKLKGEMDGQYSLSFSINGIQFRCIYEFDKENRIVTIIDIGKRESVYDYYKRSH